ncbi:MAG: toll/interleukin-1 receptor domain-containing protein [Actinomycetota bacterium]
MRVFVSHSWRDKAIADRLALDLESMVDEVWLDVRHLRPGASIQGSIDEDLGEMDLLLLVWTEHAAASDGVAAELATAARIDLDVIVCVHGTDATGRPLAPPAILGDPLTIDWDEPSLGFGRLCVELLHRLSTRAGVDLAVADATAFGEMGAILDYVGGYREREGIDGEAHHWVTRILTQLDEVQRRGSVVQERLEAGVELAQAAMDALAAEPPDRRELEALLVRATAAEADDPTLMGQLRSLIERTLSTLPPADEAVVIDIREAPSADLTPADEHELRARLAELIAPATIDEAVTHVRDYVTLATQFLGRLDQLATATQSLAGRQVVAGLAAYLQQADDLLPDRLGLLGLLDDAWLINNLTFRLVEAGIAPGEVFPVDWAHLATIDQLVTALLPPAVRHALEQLLLQYLQLLAMEIEQYQPVMGVGTASVGGSWEDQMNAGLLGTGLSVDDAW